MGGADDDLGATDVGRERAERLLDDQLDAHRGREVDDDVATVDELIDLEVVEHGTDLDVQPWIATDLAQVVEPTGRQVIEHDDRMAGIEQTFREVRSDESDTSGDQIGFLHAGGLLGGNRGTARDGSASSSRPGNAAPTCVLEPGPECHSR